MKFLIIPSLAFATIMSSCHYFEGKRIRGNGVIKMENRTAGPFSNIHVSGSAKVYVKQDSVTAVKVEADENLMEYIITDNDGSTLRIHPRDNTNLRPSRSIKIYVSGPSFRRFEASGASDFYSENKITGTEPITISLSGASNVEMELSAPKIDAVLSGAGNITLKGETKDFQVNGSGSTDIRCYELLTENTHVELSGAGNAEVFASVKLDVHVSGAADIRYKGNATVSRQVSGAGSVKKVE